MDWFLGEIRLLPYNFAPVNWALCDGAVLQIEQHVPLFSLLGNAYGGDGMKTFALPNLTQQRPFPSGVTQGNYYIAINGVYPNRG
jgi:microcystin-dependent protein